MCGITFTTSPDGMKNFHQIKHRGPTSTSTKSFTYQKYEVSLGFHRLSVTGLSNGDQPFVYNDVYVICNGEIYNHQELKETYRLPCKTLSDCEVILQLYLQGGRSISKLDKLIGEFAFVIFDSRLGVVIYARDWCGTRPMFISDDAQNKEFITLCSELKGLPGHGKQVNPGVYHVYNMIDNTTETVSMSNDIISFDVKQSLISAVRDRLRSEVPVGFLLSGGLDSSLVLSIASRLIPKDEKITVFTTGFSEDAPDVVYSKKVIKYLSSIYGKRYIHHIYIPTIEEGISCVEEVIRVIESYDTTTVRASTPMWMLGKYIQENTNIKVIISGEGSDEINGGYLYFHYSPNQQDFDTECYRLVQDIHFFDGLRADRTISSCGLELRTPFLDSRVVGATLSIDVYTGMKSSGIEKYYLRTIFRGYLPSELLWRTKAAFSDAVSTKWKDSLKIHASSLSLPPVETTHISPKSPEELWYRSIFEEHYPGQGTVIPYLWLPKWVETNGEPSATVLGIHNEIHDTKIKEGEIC
jgi:asparagine synthase (glutamine-hydrolysing)